MPRFLPRLLMLLVLALYASGGARWAHERTAHGGEAHEAPASHACHHGHHHHSDTGTEDSGGEGPDHPLPDHEHDDCPTCELLGAMKQAQLVGGAAVAPAGSLEAALVGARARAPEAARLRAFEARGPPKG